MTKKIIPMALFLAPLLALPVEVADNPAEAAKSVPVPRPPMGWGSWNSFSNTIDSRIVIEQAKAIVASGMKSAGYEYMLIDEGWWLGSRDASGNITVDPKQWPAIEPGEKAGDMSNIVRYLHRLGLKAGTYTDAGEYGCSFTGPDIGPPRPHTGSIGHYEEDFLQFAKWGFDYVKVDWCGGDKPNLDPAIQYAEIARAIKRAEAKTGHRLYFSICNWGRQSPWTWAPGIGNIGADMWRASGDITDPIVEGGPHQNRRVGEENVLKNFERGVHPEAQHTGYYNDLDMMVLGMPGMSEAENRMHMSLWALSGAPLIVGADITKLKKPELSMLNNPDVVAIQQDSLGLQCVKVSDSAGVQVWGKPLAQSGSRAVVFLNRTDSPATVSVDWDQLGLAPQPAEVRDLWAQKNLGSHKSSFSATIPAHDVAMLTIKGKEAPATSFRPAVQSDDIVFGDVRAAAKTSFVRIAYRNDGSAPSFAELRVNGNFPTRVSFPPTGGRNAVGVVTVEAELKKEKDNLLTFSPSCGATPRFDSISISSWPAKD